MMKKILLGIFFTVLFITVSLVTYFYFTYKQIYVGEKPQVIKSITIAGSATPTPDPLAPRNILLLGYGGSGHDGGLLTDTIIVAHLDPRNNNITLISIPRDIWISIQTEVNKAEKLKINAAYAIGEDDKKYPDKPPQYTGSAGGGNLAKDNVSLITGMNINYFISMNFSGFNNIVNILGGVNVYIPQTFDDNYYPVKGREDESCDKTEEEIEALTATMSGFLLEKEFECRYEQLHFDKGLTAMNADTSLKFVRSRHSETAGGDFNRSLRQQAFIVGVKNKLLNLGTIPKMIPVVNQISKNVKTDIDVKTAIDFVRDNGVSDYEIKTISINEDNVLNESISSDGQYILIPKAGLDNWEEIQKYIDNEINNQKEL